MAIPRTCSRSRDLRAFTLVVGMWSSKTSPLFLDKLTM